MLAVRGIQQLQGAAVEEVTFVSSSIAVIIDKWYIVKVQQRRYARASSRLVLPEVRSGYVEAQCLLDGPAEHGVEQVSCCRLTLHVIILLRVPTATMYTHIIQRLLMRPLSAVASK